ncbi:MAG: hypothetical protein P8L85_18165 [Rubripirellula sp.]|nr:hypothetical protein [Rubripirellula sp.]
MQLPDTALPRQDAFLIGFCISLGFDFLKDLFGSPGVFKLKFIDSYQGVMNGWVCNFKISGITILLGISTTLVASPMIDAQTSAEPTLAILLAKTAIAGATGFVSFTI